jgi:hypothetical protein
VNAPTLILAPLLALFLLLAGIRAVRLFRAWPAALEGATVEAEDADRIALEDAKHRLLVTIQDLELEYDLGKVGDADYKNLKAYYEREAVEVIKSLEKTA